MANRRSLAAGLALVAASLVAAASGAAAHVHASRIGVPTAVGALFTLTPAGALGSHFCTGSVVDSPNGNVIVTAAHCLTGRRVGSFAFVPGYHRGVAPLGVWTVERAYADRAWTASADPDHDFAFLVVAKRGARSTLEAQTGAERLGAGKAAGKKATVIGYPAASDRPIGCTNELLAFSATQVEFDCDGYTNGTSGSSLVVDADPRTGLGTVVGVIGGYEEGGDTPAVSYAAAFGASAQALYRAAIAVD
jgi:V8-like Glu-specific endopeptidase